MQMWICSATKEALVLLQQTPGLPRRGRLAGCWAEHNGRSLKLAGSWHHHESIGHVVTTVVHQEKHYAALSHCASVYIGPLPPSPALRTAMQAYPTGTTAGRTLRSPGAACLPLACRSAKKLLGQLPGTVLTSRSLKPGQPPVGLPGHGPRRMACAHGRALAVSPGARGIQGHRYRSQLRLCTP